MARVLVVDDVQPVRALVREALPEHEVDEATDGHEGLRRIEAAEYDLLVVRRRLPRMGGLPMLAAARARLKGRVPVLLRTGDPEFPATEHQLRGIDCVLRTDCSPAAVRAAAGELLEHRARRLFRVVRRTAAASGGGPRLPSRRRALGGPGRHPDRRTVAEAQLCALWTACGVGPVREVLWCESPREALEVVSAGLRRLGPWAFRNGGVPTALAWSDPGGSPREGLPWRLPEEDVRAAIRDQLVAETRGEGERCLTLLACLLAVPGAILSDAEGVLGRWADWHWFVGEGMAVVSEPPVAVHRDAAGRLHHQSRAAIEYPDGFGVPLREGRRTGPVAPGLGCTRESPLRGSRPAEPTP